MVLVLGIALAAVLLLMVFWRRHLGSLMQVASLLGALLLMIWLQNNGYLDGKGRQSPTPGGPVPMGAPR
jgi:hypothetical protein